MQEEELAWKPGRVVQTQAPNARPRGPPACGRRVPGPGWPSCLGGSASVGWQPAGLFLETQPDLLHVGCASTLLPFPGTDSFGLLRGRDNRSPGDPGEAASSRQPWAHSGSLAGGRGRSERRRVAPLRCPLRSCNPGPPPGLREGDGPSGVQDRDKETSIHSQTGRSVEATRPEGDVQASCAGEPPAARPGMARKEGSRAGGRGACSPPLENTPGCSTGALLTQRGSDPKPGLVFQSKTLPAADFWLQHTDGRSAPLQSPQKGVRTLRGTAPSACLCPRPRPAPGPPATPSRWV